MTTPGEFRNISNARKRLLFSGLERKRGISPTDIDLLIEYNGVAFIIGEGKHYLDGISKGQRRALQSVCDCLQGYRLVFFFSYDAKQTEDIEVKECLVSEVYLATPSQPGVWLDFRKEAQTVLQVIERFESLLKKEKVNF